MKKLLLIDGNSLINRSFYAIRLLSNKKGVYTNAITGFFSALLRLRNNIQPDYAAVAFDLRAPTFRHKMYDGYKKRRKGMPEELAVQMPYIKEILDAMGISRVECEGFEADDIIGTLAVNFSDSGNSNNCECLISTGDRDSFQLISDRVSVILASTKEEITYTPGIIAEKYGIEPLQFIEVKALMGDSSDDIPGVAGIGEKTAFSLISKFGSVDYIYQNLDSLEISAGVKSKLEKSREICFLSRELAQIATDAPIELSIESYKIGEGEPGRLAEILSQLEISSLLKRLNLKAVEVEEVIETEENSEKSELLDRQLQEVLDSMSETGIKVDLDGIRRFGDELESGILELQSEIYEIADGEFNISSPKQLGEILFEKLQLPHGKKTKTGYSTDSEVLEWLLSETSHEIISPIIEYRELTKLNSTYVRGLLAHINDTDGRIHTTFKNETRTGRLSSVEPNIQNIPVRTERGRILRRFFIAEEGKVLIDADYSQIELRVLAAMSGDSVMLKAFRNGDDIHAITASQVFGVSENAVTREMRSAAKAVNFGIVYGMGAFSLAKEIGVPVGEADEYIKRYLSKYAGVREFLEKTVEDAKSSGYVKTALGRVRYIPEIRSSNKNIIAAGERIAKNTPIQGTAADIIKIAMVRVHGRLKNTQSRLILQVHDELIVESPENQAEQAKEILKEEMLLAGKELGMESAVDVGIGKSWYETH